MIAMAMCCKPKLLFADEPTTALDVTVQKKILDLIKRLQKKHNMSVVFISHDLGVIAEIADRVMVMQTGKKDGMITMDSALADLVQRKMITNEEAMKHAHDKSFFQRQLMGV